MAAAAPRTAPVEPTSVPFPNGTVPRLLGIFLGSRPDCLRDESIDSLVALTEDAEPLSAPAVREALAAAWGRSPEAVLGTLAAHPFAVRAIDQFHAATLADGTPVTVRLVRIAAADLMADARRQAGALSDAIATHCLPGRALQKAMLADFLAWLAAQSQGGTPALDAPASIPGLSVGRVAVMPGEAGGPVAVWPGPVAEAGYDLAAFALDQGLRRRAIPETLTPANLGTGIDGKPAWLTTAGACALTLREAGAVRGLWAALHADDEAAALRALRFCRSDDAAAEWDHFEQLSLAAIRRHVAFPPDDVSVDRAVHRVDRVLLGILRAARMTGVAMPPAMWRAHRLLIVAYRLARLWRPQAEPERLGRALLAAFDRDDDLGSLAGGELGKLAAELFGLLREAPGRLNRITADLADGTLDLTVVSEESRRTAAAWTRRIRLLATALAALGLSVLLAQAGDAAIAGLPLRSVLGLAVTGLYAALAIQWLRLR